MGSCTHLCSCKHCSSTDGRVVRTVFRILKLYVDNSDGLGCHRNNLRMLSYSPQLFQMHGGIVDRGLEDDRIIHHLRYPVDAKGVVSGMKPNVGRETFADKNIADFWYMMN